MFGKMTSKVLEDMKNKSLKLCLVSNLQNNPKN